MTRKPTTPPTYTISLSATHNDYWFVDSSVRIRLALFRSREDAELFVRAKQVADAMGAGASASREGGPS